MIVKDNYNKLFKKKNIRFIVAGDENSLEKFVDLYFIYKENQKGPIDFIDFGCEGFIVDQEKLFIAECNAEQGYWVNKCNLADHWALGSGSYYAIGAMDAGANAKEALKIAKLRDKNTGGRIRIIKI